MDEGTDNTSSERSCMLIDAFTFEIVCAAGHFWLYMLSHSTMVNWKACLFSLPATILRFYMEVI